MNDNVRRRLDAHPPLLKSHLYLPELLGAPLSHIRDDCLRLEADPVQAKGGLNPRRRVIRLKESCAGLVPTPHALHIRGGVHMAVR